MNASLRHSTLTFLRPASTFEPHTLKAVFPAVNRALHSIRAAGPYFIYGAGPLNVATGRCETYDSCEPLLVLVSSNAHFLPGVGHQRGRSTSTSGGAIFIIR